MRTVIALGIMALAVGGCAVLPVPVQLVSWVVDGFSYMVSQKSVADHGLSAAMQKDCAFWRGLTDDRICHADEPQIPGPYLTIALAPDELWIPGPYLTIEPNSPPKHEELSALSELSLNGRL